MTAGKPGECTGGLRSVWPVKRPLGPSGPRSLRVSAIPSPGWPPPTPTRAQARHRPRKDRKTWSRRRASSSARTGPFFDLIGPIHTLTDDRGVVLGLRVAEKHLNARGFVHGAIICGLLDVAIGRNVTASTSPPSQATTASMTVQFLSTAGLGDWLEATGQVSRAGRRLAYATGAIRSDTELVATASTVFATRLLR